MTNRRSFHLGTLAAIFLTAVVATTPARAADSENILTLGDATPAKARIDQFGWLQGYWRGEGLGGDCEELWSAPIGDRMHGIFTLRRDDAIEFWEAMVLVEDGDSVVLRLKHFTAEFVGWEEKAESVDFPLVRVEEGAAYFSGLTYRLEEDGTLSILLALHQDGKRTEHTFRFRPAAPRE